MFINLEMPFDSFYIRTCSIQKASQCHNLSVLSFDAFLQVALFAGTRSVYWHEYVFIQLVRMEEMINCWLLVDSKHANNTAHGNRSNMFDFLATGTSDKT